MFGSTLIILKKICWKKLENKEQRTESGLSGICLVWVLPTKLKDNLSLLRRYSIPTEHISKV